MEKENHAVQKWEVTEICPHCENEVVMQWNVASDGFKAFCPHCGKRLMLCDECRHRTGDLVCDCDYNSETDSCRFNPSPEKESLLIAVTETEITPIKFETFKEARELMMREYLAAGGTTDNKDNAHCDYCEIDSNSACVMDGTNHDNYSWLIVEI